MHDLVAEQAYVAAFGVGGANERSAESDAACAAAAAEVVRLSELQPGAEFAAELVRVGCLVMDTKTRVALYAQWERLRAWADAQSMAVLADAAGMPDPDSDRWLVSDVALTTRLSEQSVGTRMALMRQVGECLDATWTALNAGQITSAHLFALAGVTRNVSREVARQVEERVLEPAIARGWAPAKLRDAARRALLRIDPGGEVVRAEDAKKQRSGVTLRADEDEMATLSASTDAWTAWQLMDEINRRADRMRLDGDERSVGELQIAALEHAMLGGDTGTGEVRGPGEGGAVRRQPKRATAVLLLTLDTLLGGSGQAHLDGYGPITAELARRIAASDVRFRRLVFDPMTGKPVDVGDAAYELSPQMRRWIEARDRTCRFPGCRRRAAFCDADHAEEWPHGTTTSRNCGLLCRRHHNYKTCKAWDLTRDEDDGVSWTSPNRFEWYQPAATYAEFLQEERLGQWIQSPDPPPEELPRAG